MNTGAISSRYARALLLYATERGREDVVYAQVKSLLENPGGGSQVQLCQELDNFAQLVARKGRMNLIKFILRSYMTQYEQSRGIHVVKIAIAFDSEQIKSRLEEFVRSKVDGTLQFEFKTDPSLMGGFIIDIDDRRLDLSVSGRLRDISKRLIEKNNRIV